MDPISPRFLRSLLDRAEKVQVLVQLPGDRMRVHVVDPEALRQMLKKGRREPAPKPEKIKEPRAARPAKPPSQPPAPKPESLKATKARVIEGFPGWLKGAAKRLGISPQELKAHYAAGRAKCQGWYVKPHWTDQPLNKDWICQECMQRKADARAQARGLLTPPRT